MEKPGARRGGSVPLIGALFVIVCCGAPLLLAAIAATGTGAALAALGWPALGTVLVLAGVLIAALLLRRSTARDCATSAPAEVTRG